MSDIQSVIDFDSTLAGAVEAIARPHASMTPAGVPTSAKQSYVGGFPFMPIGAEWPLLDASDPLVFVAQINFATVPPMDGFPTEGMLQWFLEGEGGNAYGLYGPDLEDAANGKHGLHVRWWTAADLTGDSTSQPTDTVPYEIGEGGFAGPLLSANPVAVTFTPGLDLPSRNEVNEAENAAFEFLDDAYDQLCRADDDFFPASGDKVGGYPRFEQGPTFPVAALAPDVRVLIQLDSESKAFAMWGDLGVGQLMGDAFAVSRGDFSSVVWDWACG